MTLLPAGDIWNLVLAILAALGGGGAIVLSLSSWLGKIWAERLLETQKSKFQIEFAELKAGLDKQIHVHNLAATRIDAQRVDAVRKLYGALVAWHEAVIQIVAPNNFTAKPSEQAVEMYAKCAAILRAKSERLESIAMRTAIYFPDETYQIVARCGMSASMMSIEFLDAVRKSATPDAPAHLAAIEFAKTTLADKYQTDYEPARRTVVMTFRQMIDPNACANS